MTIANQLNLFDESNLNYKYSRPFEDMDKKTLLQWKAKLEKLVDENVMPWMSRMWSKQLDVISDLLNKSEVNE